MGRNHGAEPDVLSDSALVEARDGIEESEKFELLLGDNPDASVIADATRLMASVPAPPGVDAEGKIVIEYLGLGQLQETPGEVRAPEVEPLSEAELQGLESQDPDFTSFIGINLATRNQFKVTMPRELITGLAPPTLDDAPDIQAGPGDFDDVQEGIQGLLQAPQLAAETAEMLTPDGPDYTAAAGGDDALPGWSLGAIFLRFERVEMKVRGWLASPSTPGASHRVKTSGTSSTQTTSQRDSGSSTLVFL